MVRGLTGLSRQFLLACSLLALTAVLTAPRPAFSQAAPAAAPAVAPKAAPKATPKAVPKKAAPPVAAPAPALAPDGDEPQDGAGDDNGAAATTPQQTPPAGQPTAGQTSPQVAAAAKAAAPPKQLVGTTTGWVRVCQKMKDNDKEGCSIRQDVVAENGAFLASLAVQEVTGQERRQLIVTTPLGMAIQAGLLVRIDEDKASPAKFGTCLVNGCFAGLEINMDLIGSMKKGKNAFVTVRNIQGAALDLTIPLTTFAKAYDGPATDVQALQLQQKKLQEELLKRAEKAREELLKQQGGTPPAQTTAPAQPK